MSLHSPDLVLEGRLQKHLADSVRPFVWGAHDCMMFLADWCVAAGWPDPAGELRGTYDDALGATRIVERFGGFVSFVRARLEAIGMTETKRPRRGDVALCMAPTHDGGDGLVGAICLFDMPGPPKGRPRHEHVPSDHVDKRVASLGNGGLVLQPFPVMIAWAIRRPAPESDVKRRLARLRHA